MQARPVSFATQQSRKRKGVDSQLAGVKQVKLDPHKASTKGSYDNIKYDIEQIHSIVPLNTDQHNNMHVLHLQRTIASALNE